VKLIQTSFVDLNSLPIEAHRTELDRLYADASLRNLGFGLLSTLNLGSAKMPSVHLAFRTA
jgi:hypothetical protein